MTDTFRALCAELLQGLDENRHEEVRYPGHLRIIMARARAALAQPEPAGEVGVCQQTNRGSESPLSEFADGGMPLG